MDSWYRGFRDPVAVSAWAVRTGFREWLSKKTETCTAVQPLNALTTAEWVWTHGLLASVCLVTFFSENDNRHSSAFLFTRHSFSCDSASFAVLHTLTWTCLLTCYTILMYLQKPKMWIQHSKSQAIVYNHPQCNILWTLFFAFPVQNQLKTLHGSNQSWYDWIKRRGSGIMSHRLEDNVKLHEQARKVGSVCRFKEKPQHLDQILRQKGRVWSQEQCAMSQQSWES